VLVKFLNDTIVVPRDSEWFGFYADGQDSKLQALEESPLYQEDWLGLKTLNESGRLLMLSCHGNHLHRMLSEWDGPPALPPDSHPHFNKRRFLCPQCGP
jgi:palmitoyl-protein thioesterase